MSPYNDQNQGLGSDMVVHQRMVFAVVCYTIYSNSGFWRRKETNQVLFGRAMYDGACGELNAMTQVKSLGRRVKGFNEETWEKELYWKGTCAERGVKG